MPVSERISTNGVSVEWSLQNLNVDTSFLKIEQEMTTLQLFVVARLIDFGHDRSTNVILGRDFAHCIAMVTPNVLECIQQILKSVGGVNHSDSDLGETGKISA